MVEREKSYNCTAFVTIWRLKYVQLILCRKIFGKWIASYLRIINDEWWDCQNHVTELSTMNDAESWYRIINVELDCRIHDIEWSIMNDSESWNRIIKDLWRRIMIYNFQLWIRLLDSWYRIVNNKWLRIMIYDYQQWMTQNHEILLSTMNETGRIMI